MSNSKSKDTEASTNYLFVQTSGMSTTKVIVRNPQVTDGVVYATQIANLVGWDDENVEVYTFCTPAKFIAGGGPWTMTEYFGQIYETD